jgi:hypothetical protein
VPNEELMFDAQGRFKIYTCSQKITKLKTLRHYPLPAVAFFGYYFIKSAFAFKIIKSLLWSLPLTFAYGVRKNLNDNAKSMIHEIYLY